jgi:uncharacterized membrane protein YdfJ with MMPL/SSD domain
MGAILGIAVLLDAFLVRLLLVPVLLRLTGSAAWYLPAWLERLLPNVSFGHGSATDSVGEAQDRSTVPSKPVPSPSAMIEG